MRFINRVSVIWLFAICGISLYSAECVDSDTYSIKEAYAIVRDYTVEVNQTDIYNATVTTRKIVTVLNKEGSGYGHFTYTGNRFRELTDFRGVIKDATGKEIKKIKKSDLLKTTLSEEMSSDIYTNFYEYNSPVYPFTIEYTYKEKWKNGIIMYPSFHPLLGYHLALENASYKITVPTTMELRYKLNGDFDIRKSESGDSEEYLFSIKNVSPIVWESYAPGFRELFPWVLLAPSEFCYDSHCGNMNSWDKYGEWVNFLLADRDALPPNFSSEVIQMTSVTSDTKEKVKILYEYLQNNFRYVSIQLGIGGFQPMEASKVLNARFGDCKALTNLMKAMLRVIEIPSYYCEISTEEKDLYEDFTNVSQTNHAVLLVPLANDSVWLECTSTDLPFGYVHNSIVGKDALVVTGEGGKICKVTNYPDKQNKTVSSLNLQIKESGEVDGKIVIDEYLSNYESISSYLKRNDRQGQIKFLNSNLNIPDVRIGEIKVKEYKQDIPCWEVDASFVTDRMINKTGKRIFIPLCPLKKANLNVFKSSTRNHDIVIERGYVEQDSIVFELPSAFLSESLPKGIDIKTKFGNYITTLQIEENKVIYTQRIEIFSGKYDKSLYNDIKKFFSDIMSGIDRKMVFKMEEI